MHYSDREIAKNIGDGDPGRLTGRLAGTFAYYRDKAPHLYAILACHPGISEKQRTIVLTEWKEHVQKHLMSVQRDTLDIVFEDSGVTIHAAEFISIRDRIAKQLGIELLETA